LSENITKRIKAEEEVKELNDVRNKFIRIVSHQLSTSLTSIRFNLELLDTGTFKTFTPEVKSILKVMIGANIHVIERIGDLLIVIDIEEGRVSLGKETASPISMLTSLEGVFKEKFTEKKIKYSSSKEGGIPDGEVDREKLTKVVNILLQNAVDYT